MIYFDNAATTNKKPVGVQRALMESLSYSANPSRGGYPLSLAASERVFAVRKSAAEFFRTTPKNIVFTGGATHALNAAIIGSAKKDARVVTTAYEHNSVLRPLFALKRDGVITLRIIEPSENDNVLLQSLKRQLEDGAGLLVFTAVSNVNGRRLPYEKMINLAHSYGARVILDASQAAGNDILNLRENPPDILCTAGHKSLFGIMGVGIMAFPEKAEFFPEPVFSGGSGVMSRSSFMPPESPERFEAGTLPLPAIMALGGGLDFLLKCGAEKVKSREKILKNYLLSKFPREGVTNYTSASSHSIILFNIDGADSDEAAAAFADEGVALRSGLHCAPLIHDRLGTSKTGAVRLSLSYFNTVEEADCFISKLRKITNRYYKKTRI